MQKLSTRLSLAAILVACYSQANAIDLTCSNEYGCNFYISGDYKYIVSEPLFTNEDDRVLLIGEDKLKTDDYFNIIVKSGYYNNKQVFDNNITKDNSLFSAESLFGDRITIQKGVFATLKNYPNQEDKILLLDRDTGIIEDGIKFIVGEKSNKEEDQLGGIAIEIRNKSNLILKGGNIVLNGADSRAIVSSNSTAEIDNLSILMNSAGAIAISGIENLSFRVNNLSVLGDKDNQVVFYLDRENQKHLLDFKLSNSNVSLKNNSIIVSMNGPAEGDQNSPISSEVNISNSIISAGYFFNYVTDNPSKDSINIKIDDSEIKTEQLIRINNQDMIDTSIEEDFLESSEITNNLSLKIQADQGAKLQGVSYINPNYQHGTVDLTLNGNSQWKFKGDSTLDNLSVNNSTVEFEPDSAFHTLTINQDLSGSGEFILNSDLASEKADQIIVKGSVAGDHRLQVRNSRNEPKKENGKVILVKTNSGDGTFSLKDKPYVDAGIYRYELAKDNNNWVLAHKGKSANTEEPQPQPQPQPQGDDEGARTFSQYANNVISIQQAARAYLYTQGETVSERVGFLHNTERLTGFWVQNTNNWSEVDSYQTLLANTSGFKQRNHLLNVGYDTHFVNQDTYYYAGLYTGLGQGKIDFDKDYGSAKIKGNHIGIYGGMQWQNGLFLDADYSYNRLRLSGDEVDKQSFNAHSLRLGTGIKLPMSANWNVVPQASISATKFNGNTTYRSKLGAQFMGNIAFSSLSLKPYAGIYWLNDFGSSDIVINQYKADIQSFGNRAQFELGTALKTTLGSFDVSVKNQMGSRYRENVQLNLGYSYQW
ncbi:autotransporter outer membrane beta-barrel domain-containing protein [Avibacterium avium]|uniref:autotransporter outer membrane beta-barrel domain-containing protein n=1 Tax=Avibacterium avium TaxID=751 RepID=UPI003BF90F0D